MREEPYYYNSTFNASNDTEINYTVEFISNGNTGVTNIELPNSINKRIVNSNTVSLGVAGDLRNGSSISFSRIFNPIPEEDEIIIDFKINGELLFRHENLKSETDSPEIFNIIKFPAP